MNQLKLVAGYFRISQARDDMRAPELYRDEIEGYCSYRKLNLAKIFSDIDSAPFGVRGPDPLSISKSADAVNILPLSFRSFLALGDQLKNSSCSPPV